MPVPFCFCCDIAVILFLNYTYFFIFFPETNKIKYHFKKQQKNSLGRGTFSGGMVAGGATHNLFLSLQSVLIYILRRHGLVSKWFKAMFVFVMHAYTYIYIRLVFSNCKNPLGYVTRDTKMLICKHNVN